MLHAHVCAGKLVIPTLAEQLVQHDDARVMRAYSTFGDELPIIGLLHQSCLAQVGRLRPAAHAFRGGCRRRNRRLGVGRRVHSCSRFLARWVHSHDVPRPEGHTCALVFQLDGYTLASLCVPVDAFCVMPSVPFTIPMRSHVYPSTHFTRCHVYPSPPRRAIRALGVAIIAATVSASRCRAQRDPLALPWVLTPSAERSARVL